MRPTGFIQHVDKGQKHPTSRMNTHETEGTYLKIAKIVRVDYENMLADIVYVDSIGSVPKISISAGYAGYRSFLGGMPAVNDWAIVSFAKSGNFNIPYIISFLPRGYVTGIRNDLVRVSKSLQETGQYNPLRFKMQKLYEGEIYGSSKYGSEFYLDKNVTISNSKLNEINLKASDQTISMSSVNNSINTSGTRVYSGLAKRNDLLYDRNPEFRTSKGTSRFPVFYDETGVPNYVPTHSSPINVDYPYGQKTLDDSKKGFVEHRLEIAELADPITPVTEANSGVNVDTLYSLRPDGKANLPSVIQILGTYIGNDSTSEDGKKKYGKILKPKIFRSTTDIKGYLTEDACISDNGRDEPTSLAAAYVLKFPKSGTAFYVNKQGKYYANIAASSAIDPLGSGESAEINLTGHAKVNIGKNTERQRSLSFVTDGGVFSNWGFDNNKSRSWDATFRKGIAWNILAADSEGHSFLMQAEGDVRTKIKGSRYTEISGDDITLVHGVLEDRVFGKKVDNFVNDKATNYGGSYTETSIGHYSQTIGSGRSAKILAPNVAAGETVADKVEIVTGNSEYNMLLGNKSENLKVGNYTTTLVAGNRNIDITLGNFSVKISAGNIAIKTIAGTVDIGTTTGSVDITGSLGVNIKSATSVNITAPKVQVGGSPIQGGVVNGGACGQKCYFSGAPHIGSTTVTVNSC